MDLTIKLEDTNLNIRAVVLVETEEGFVFGQGEGKNYFHTLGGRVKLGEGAMDAAKREALEEIGQELSNLKLNCIVENFFTHETNQEKYHEINFVFTADKIQKVDGSFGMHVLNKEKIISSEIRPNILKEIILSEKTGNYFIVNK